MRQESLQISGAARPTLTESVTRTTRPRRRQPNPNAHRSKNHQAIRITKDPTSWSEGVDVGPA
jgi:hypothetical protein